VQGADALDAFERLKATTKSTPLVLGCAFDFTMISEIMERNREEEPSIAIILDRAKDIEFPGTLRDAQRRAASRLRSSTSAIEEVIGDRPGEAGEVFGLTAAHQYTGEPYPRVHIALLPTQDWTEAPAYLRAGGWNDCPDAAMQVAALRYWRDRYQIELVGCSFDTMNIRVGMGPASREEALSLAEEHMLFCSEIPPNELIDHAANLIAHSWWYFWWD
jgi:hypothetical protein